MDMTAPPYPPLAPPLCGKINAILGRIGDKWTVRVIMTLEARPHRFNEIRRAIDGVSQQMLARTLRALERDGLVLRTVLPTNPPQVEYALTALGRSLAEPVRALGSWAIDHMETIEARRAAYDTALQG